MQVEIVYRKRLALLLVPCSDSESLTATKVVRVKLEPEAPVVQLATIVFAVLKHIDETSHACVVRQRAGVFALAVMLDLPVDAVPQDALALRHVRAVLVVAVSDALADVRFVAAVVLAVELAVVVLVCVRPVAAIGPLLARSHGCFGHFLAMGVDVAFHFLGDVTGGVIGE